MSAMIDLRDEQGHLLGRVSSPDATVEIKCRKCKELYTFHVQQYRVSETSKQILSSLK